MSLDALAVGGAACLAGAHAHLGERAIEGAGIVVAVARARFGTGREVVAFAPRGVAAGKFVPEPFLRSALAVALPAPKEVGPFVGIAAGGTGRPAGPGAGGPGAGRPRAGGPGAGRRPAV